MGVDFFPCANCGESICDCGDYVRCGDDCGRRWCCEKCALEDGFSKYDEELGEYSSDFKTCKYCRDEELEDYILVDFLLKRAKLTRKKAIKLFFDKQKRKK
jgi:hypothetical protein